MMYVLAGEKARALDWLERAYQTRDPSVTGACSPPSSGSAALGIVCSRGQGKFELLLDDVVIK